MRSLLLPSSDTSCPSLLKCARACSEHHRPCFDRGVGEWLLHQPNVVHAHLHVHDDLIVWREEAVIGCARGRGQIVEAPTRVLVDHYRQAAGLRHQRAGSPVVRVHPAGSSTESATSRLSTR